MNILYNASRCGIGNNGGSKTIIKSAETLRKLGHKVRIWAEVNYYTWHDLKVPIYKQSKKNKDILYNPNFEIVGFKKQGFDTIINVSIWDVKSTLKSPIENKVWWMRGWETWVKGEDYLINQIKRFVDSGGRIIVNSGWLKDKLKSINIKSSLCWAGLDLDFGKDSAYWRDGGKGLYQKYKSYTIGGLWHPKHKTKNYHIFEQLQKHFQGNDRYEFKTLGNTLNNNQLLEFYNECDIWLALSELEGFHQVPAEAALCGCGIIYNDVDSGGTRDYCTPETATPFKSFEELVQVIEDYDFYKGDKVEKMLWLLNKKIGNRETNMKKFVEVLR
jgi:hypothetical protein